MKDEILHKAKQFELIISELRKESTYYPSVLIKYYERNDRLEKTESSYSNTLINKLTSSLLSKPREDVDKDCYASTLVRIERNGKWYNIHCVESIFITENCNEKQLLLTMMESVYQIQHLYCISEINHPDNIQESEIERLSLLYHRKPINHKDCPMKPIQ